MFGQRRWADWLVQWDGDAECPGGPGYQDLDIKTWISKPGYQKSVRRMLLAAQKYHHHLTREGIRHVGFYPRHIR
jgi:hypothetical protein